MIGPKAISTAAILLLLVVHSRASGSPPPVTDGTLHAIAAALEMFVDELPQLPRLRGYTAAPNGSFEPAHLTIGMYKIKWKFHRDFPATTVFAYGTSALTATVPGPQIEAMRGVSTQVTWENHLPKSHILPFDKTIPVASPKHGGIPTVVHLHGGINPPQSDGSALAWFTANFQETGPQWSGLTYTYPNIQHSGDLWYHDHALGLTRVNLLAGLIGPYVLRDVETDKKLNLPRGTEFDRSLMVFDRSFYKDGSLYMNVTGDNPSIHPQWQPEYFGDAIIVNGKAWPYLHVQRRKYRLRITNASNARFFRFSLSNGLPFTVLTSDASYLPSPVNTRKILLAPAETIGVVVDFSLTETDQVLLKNDAPYPFPSGNTVDSLNGQVMKFVILPRTSPDTSTVPASLVTYKTSPVSNTTNKRYITLYEYESTTGNPAHLFINGKRFLDPVTETPKTGSAEVWEVINLTNDNHPLHIHLAEFREVRAIKIVGLKAFKACMVVKKDATGCDVGAHATGRRVPGVEYEKTWKNILKIRPGYMTTIIVKFNLVENDTPYPFDATANPGYVYHCHILDHEDNEMIRPLKLVA